MAETPNDVALLAELGYKQEFKRRFSVFETFGISFTLIGLVPSMTSVLVYAVPYGGAVSMIWGWLTASFFIVLITLSLAELGSAAPTSGGLYYWTFKYASPRYRNLLCWIAGYANTIGLISGIASIGWGGAVQIMACASIGSNLTFVPTTGQIYGVFTALIICEAVIASCATRIIARLQKVYVLANVLLILAVIIAVAAATPSAFRNTGKFAFGEFVNLTPWPNGFAFVLSFLAPLWTINGFDAGVHISEEVTNARVAVPIAIIAPAAVSAILGFVINIVLGLSMGTDTAGILADPIGQPMATILFNSLGTRGTLAIFSCIAIVQFMMGTEIMIASSRQTFAFARDGALPGSKYLYRVNRLTQTPVNCVWFGALIGYLLGLLAFAGPAAIGAIFSLGVSAQYVAYSIPIGSRLFFKNDFRPGPFSLGKLSYPIGVISVLWMVFIIIVFFFPSVPGPTSQTMNYTVVVLGGWLILSLAFYYLPVVGGVHWFEGPIRNAGLKTSVSDSDEVTEGKGGDVDSKRSGNT